MSNVTPKKSSRSKKRTRGGSRWREVLDEAFAGHGRDVLGVALFALGIVAGLGLYGDVAGPLGRGLGDAILVSVGLPGYAVPVALVVAGGLLMRGDGEHERSLARPTVGGALLVLAVTGSFHLVAGRPGWDEPASAFAEAGGYLGAGVAAPLDELFGVWAAGILLAAVAVVGLLIATDRTLRDVGEFVAAVLRPIASGVRRGWHLLFSLGERDLPEDLDLDDEAVATAVLEPEPGAPGDDFEDVEPPWAEALADEAVADEAPPTVVVATPSSYDDESDDGAPEGDSPDEEDTGEPEQLAIDLGPAAAKPVWKLPSAKLLDRSTSQDVDTAIVEERGRVLERALAEHGVETRLVGMVVGPTVTRFELELAAGVKVARVMNLHRDIAYAMASPDVRILAPIPGRQAIGVEVPNEDRQVVAVGDILASEEARRANHPLEVAIGRDINGRSVLADLSTMPHLLIAGQTGAGKSSCLNALLTSVLMRSTPDQVRMILVDPKRVELGQYNRLPHLLTQVVTNPKKAANALSWVVREMERRYDLLSEVGVRDIAGYNAAWDRGELRDDLDDAADDDTADADATDTSQDASGYERLPYILVVVDELNDLMMVAARDVEESICRLAQMARAVGIHLVIATQRPSVNVITGVIKANIPARLAFAVSSLADSRVILDQPGAERLVGRGDMLLLRPSSSIAQRIQGCWVDEREVRGVVAHWRRQSPDLAYKDEEVQGTDDAPAGTSGAATGGAGDDDELLAQATDLVVRSQLGSTSMLQRKLRVGFARAGRLMDLLEQRGVVGPSEGSKARAVLMTPEELGAPADGEHDDADESIPLNV